jgi:integrase
MNAPHEPAVAAAVQDHSHTLATAAGMYLLAFRGADPSRPLRLSAWVRLLGDKPLATITPEEVEDGIKQLQAEGSRVYAGKDVDGKSIYRKRGSGIRGPATINRYFVALCALFTWARKNRLLPRGFESPCKYVEKQIEPRGRVRYLKTEERDQLLAACKGSSWARLYLLVLLALTTGARRGELLGLRWCDIDLDRGEAILLDTKNGDRRTLVLLPMVLVELAQFVPKDATTSVALVFRSRLRPSQPFAFKIAWQEALATAGVRNFHFHDLRHSFASYSAQTGASLLEIADALGHRTMKMVQRYSHLSTDSRRLMVSRTFEGRL